MEGPLALLVGCFFASAIYLMLSDSLIRILLGVTILSNAVNLLIFTAGRIVKEVPPIIPEDAMVPPIATANPLPQALILTAIVISFSFFAFLLVLVFRTYQGLGTDKTGKMHMAEEPGDPVPPRGY
ncbi:multicomponent Na+:H+ antiporter subunit C [Rhodopseudomonas julia]|uniref:Multicomponent Na+:H+ antiporter subunit C n=1 Tax=Rhodopseudomonas julia TaxID=200617 RepID=A0ABU0C239_9BRAD|nr:Na+/H+ antiporter subunit C [Rhodopseudomonas julia]MDQ0324565.1 multicomponent Na+:H+ antiporter subunit C [Rhodopseudomonas julia]